MAEGARRTKAELRLIVDNVPVMIWRSDLTKGCDYFNGSWLEFTGRTLAQELGTGWAEGIHPEDFERRLEIYSSAFDQRREFSLVYRLRRRNGDYRYVLDRGRPHYGSDGSFSGYCGACLDVTDTHLASETLQGAPEGKEVLLQELRHRIQNNMQLVASLLALQSAEVASEEAKAALGDAAGRIRSIGLAHEHLRVQGGTPGVDLAAYVQALVDAVKPSAPSGVRIELAASPFTLPLQIALPTGLIVNELLSQVARVMFPSGRGGVVRVAVDSAGSHPAITISHEGTQPPGEPMATDRKALGLRLTERLARQAGIELEESEQPSRRFVLRLPVLTSGAGANAQESPPALPPHPAAEESC